jgi:hypothetical protein
MSNSTVPVEWSKHLTQELRTHFESVGEDCVQFDVSNHNYGSKDKQFAALAWLAEQRDGRRRRDAIRFHMIFWTALATLLATLWAVVVAKGWL